MYPKLRPHEAGWIQHNGQPVLYLRERTGLSEHAVAIPAALAPMLSLCDGTRDVGRLRTAFMLHSGIDLPTQVIEQILDQLDAALLLDSPRAAAAERTALQAFRAAPFRQPILAGKAYPEEPHALRQRLDEYVESSRDIGQQDGTRNKDIRGVISPHIDFERGGHVYARVWCEALEAVREAEVVVIFGTDHAGKPGKLTFTRQSYGTPWGVLPTDTSIVDEVAETIGHDDAFEEELNHRSEHSIELASIWLHYTLDGSSRKVVPILCGSFHHFALGIADPSSDRRLESALAALRNATAGKRTVVIAAADLAHVGPAFGDPSPFGAVEKAMVSAADKVILSAIERGSADEFLRHLRDEGDRRRVCGMPPIYMTLRLLKNSSGYTVDYTQCPADATGGSLVSIAGVVLM